MSNIQHGLWLVLLTVLHAQPADSLIVKYFPTNLTRGMILTKPADQKQVRGTAYFKACYTTQGDLVQVEYVPAPDDRGCPSAPAGGWRYFAAWNPWQRKLSGPLTEADLPDRRYYRAEFAAGDVLRRIGYFNSAGTEQWTYHLRRDRAGTHTLVEVEYQINRPLTLLDKFLFAPELSEMRPGWVARFFLRCDGLPLKAMVLNDRGQEMYSYRFQYGKDGPNRIITVRYFRSDGQPVGYHELYFAPDDRQPRRVAYFSGDGTPLKSVEYQWNPAGTEVAVTDRDGQGRVTFRRVLTVAAER